MIALPNNVSLTAIAIETRQNARRCCCNGGGVGAGMVVILTANLWMATRSAVKCAERRTVRAFAEETGVGTAKTMSAGRDQLAPAPSVLRNTPERSRAAE